MLDLKLNTKELIEVVNKETGDKDFLLLVDGQWVIITEEEYNNIIEGEKNGL